MLLALDFSGDFGSRFPVNTFHICDKVNSNLSFIISNELTEDIYDYKTNFRRPVVLLHRIYTLHAHTEFVSKQFSQN